MNMDKPPESNTPVPTEFGKFLRMERIDQGMRSSRKIAEAPGITVSMLSEIENGKKNTYPDINFLIRCRDFFGWKIQEGDDQEIRIKKIKKQWSFSKKAYYALKIFY